MLTCRQFHLSRLNGLLAILFLLTGCAETKPTMNRQPQLIQILEHEMRANSGWVQIHAAEALAEHGVMRPVHDTFAPLVNVPSPCQIGVWRVMARVSPTEEIRDAYSERIRAVMLDANATNRLQAVESLAKLNVAESADRPALKHWLSKTDDATAAFVYWELALSSSEFEREADEAALVKLLDSSDAIARLRAAFALGKFESLSPESLAHLNRREEVEPKDSPARLYLITANLRHAGHDSEFALKLKTALRPYLLRGTPAEQLEAGTVLGLCSDAEDRAAAADLNALLTSREADARIGAASGLLSLFAVKKNSPAVAH